jgi:hypothetical protein
MRVALVCSVFVIAACGGAQKPAASEADTSSLESAGSPSTPSSSSSSSSDSSGSGASSPTSAAAPAATSTSSTTAAAPPAAPAAIHPVPGATGSLEGKPFAPKLAQVSGPLQKDGRLVVMIHEGSDCLAPSDAKPGDGSMTLMVPWQDGYKVDLGSLKRAKNRDLGEAAFVRVGSDGKGHVSKSFQPTGRLTIVSAPTQQNAFGKLKLDLSSGDYILAGDLDVKVCGALK